MAAGAARRFGTRKLMFFLPGGEPVGVSAARNLVSVLPDSLAVVRPGDPGLAEKLSRVGLRVVENPAADDGMGASLAFGVLATPDAAGWLIALADMPWIRPATIGALRDALHNGASLVAPVYGDRRGHPVGFAARWRSHLQGLTGDQGARHLVASHASEMLLLPTTDQGVLRDIDTLADLEPRRPD